MPQTIPVIPGPQVVPSAVCFRCDVCCRFPEQDSFLRPYFTEDEIRQAVTHGILSSSFPDHRGSQIEVVRHPNDEGFLCPAFDPITQHCRIYEVRPLDCQLYPFALMWNAQHEKVVLGWDTLCPFLLEQAGEENPFRKADPQPSALTIPKAIMEQAQRVAIYLESDNVLNALAGHPRLVTPFQPDVVVLHTLDRLTETLQSSTTHDKR
ncbi:MAG TPA: YkgJ family cysteine cluster protein [Nitrospirales bacterium]|nr:YkgJ family cysteine cluster protein [Nitrospirales bacterium]